MADYLIPPFIASCRLRHAKSPFLAKAPFNKHPGLILKFQIGPVKSTLRFATFRKAMVLSTECFSAIRLSAIRPSPHVYGIYPWTIRYLVTGGAGFNRICGSPEVNQNHGQPRRGC